MTIYAKYEMKNFKTNLNILSTVSFKFNSLKFNLRFLFPHVIFFELYKIIASLHKIKKKIFLDKFYIYHEIDEIKDLTEKGLVLFSTLCERIASLKGKIFNKIIQSLSNSELLKFIRFKLT